MPIKHTVTSSLAKSERDKGRKERSVVVILPCLFRSLPFLCCWGWCCYSCDYFACNILTITNDDALWELLWYIVITILMTIHLWYTAGEKIMHVTTYKNISVHMFYSRAQNNNVRPCLEKNFVFSWWWCLKLLWFFIKGTQKFGDFRVVNVDDDGGDGSSLLLYNIKYVHYYHHDRSWHIHVSRRLSSCHDDGRTLHIPCNYNVFCNIRQRLILESSRHFLLFPSSRAFNLLGIITSLQPCSKFHREAKLDSEPFTVRLR